MNLNFVFKSSDHLRYENGRHVAGPHGGANRAIKVEPSITGGGLADQTDQSLPI